MKKLGKILLGIVGVFIIAMAAVFFFTADMVTSADKFFAAVKSKDMKEAYTYLSEDFQAGVSQSDLTLFLKQQRMDTFKEVSWGSRSINGSSGSLTGTITNESGGVIPITLSFVKGEEGWKIHYIQKESSGIQEESSPRQMPSEQKLVQLVSKSMHVFAESVNAKSMTIFRTHVSNLWQKQFTVEQFDQAFGNFYDTGINLTVLEKYSPQFSAKPKVNEDGVLIITGHYPTKPSQVKFTQKYIYEGLSWKLLGFSIDVE